MSVQKLNKITNLKPEKQTLEEFQGPSKSLTETLDILRNVKTELREVEHYIEKCKGSEEGVKAQLEGQIIKAKQEMVKLSRMLTEELEAEEESDVFEDSDKERERKLG